MTTEKQLRLHKGISYVKSAARIGACIAGIDSVVLLNLHWLIAAFAILGLAEALGILEEMVVD